jgi:hypothetical protein
MMAAAFVLVALAILGVAVLYGWRSELERKDLVRRNEELTDQILRNRGEHPVFHPEERQPLRKVPGHWDGTLAPSQRGTTTK